MWPWRGRGDSSIVAYTFITCWILTTYWKERFHSRGGKHINAHSEELEYSNHAFLGKYIPLDAVSIITFIDIRPALGEVIFSTDPILFHVHLYVYPQKRARLPWGKCGGVVCLVENSGRSRSHHPFETYFGIPCWSSATPLTACLQIGSLFHFG